MHDEEIDQSYLEQLKERVNYLEEVNRFTFDILDKMVSLGGILTRSPLELNHKQIFRDTEAYLQRLYMFDVLAFLIVNKDDHDFSLGYCSSKEVCLDFQKEVDVIINDGNFAWALKQNRSVLINSTNFGKKKVVLHSLSTKTKIVGMFIGVLANHDFKVGDISSDLFSIILYNCAQALVNSDYYYEIEMANKQLTIAMEERIRSEEKRRKLEHELMQQSHLSSIGLLTAGIAHNLRSPLTALMGYLQLSEDGRLETGDVEKMLQLAQHMNSIIQTMLVKSRRCQETKKTEVNINDMIRTELDLLKADTDFKHTVEKEYFLDTDLPVIKVVYCELSQAFMNLVNNALHAMHGCDHKKLSVRTWFDGRFVFISISDTGCGIPEENMSQLFSPFFTTKPKGDHSDQDGPTGTGLGLYSSYQLIQNYQGSIDVESEVEVGTTFTIRIPYKVEDED